MGLSPGDSVELFPIKFFRRLAKKYCNRRLSCPFRGWQTRTSLSKELIMTQLYDIELRLELIFRI